MRSVVGSAVTAPDRFRLLSWQNDPTLDFTDTGYANTDGLSPAVLNPNARRIVIAAKGQSNIGDNDFDNYQPTQSGNLMLNPHDGQIYHARNPMLGPNATVGNKACWLLRVADLLITRGLADEVVSGNVAVNGSPVATWGPSGSLSHRMTVLHNRFGMRALVPNFLIRHQGESGAVANYGTNLQAEIAFDRGAGFTCPYIVCVASYSISTGIQPSIRAAQLAAVNPALGIYQGVDTDQYGADMRGDGLHFGQSAAIAIAAGIADTIEGILLS